MRKIIIFIIFLISLFIVNLIFYFLSDDYRFFIKKIKNPDNIVYLDNKTYDDTSDNKILENAEIVNTDKNNEKIFKLKDDTWKVELKNKVVLWKSYKEILNLFSIYKLNKLEVNSNLFDITDEYPDNYFEYYSKDLTVYFFPTKTYSEVFDIFDVLSKELPFWLNETNTFWNNSFYINLNKDIQDSFVRVIISYNGIVFWLKIKKTEYSLIKEKLNSLK